MDIEKRAEELAEYYFVRGGNNHKSLSRSVANLVREAVAEAIAARPIAGSTVAGVVIGSTEPTKGTK